MSAIDAFFTAVSNGEIITLNPSINDELDFYRKNYDSPAEVSITFSLKEEEIAELTDSIIEDSPQLTNAVGDLDSDLRLNVQISFILRPRPYACISRISLTPPKDRSNNVDLERILLRIDKGAAASLESKQRQYQNLERRITEIGDLLNSIDRDDWSRLRRDQGVHPPLYRYLARRRRTPIDNDTQQLLETAIDDSSTYDDFRNALEAEIETLTRHTENFGKNELDQEYVQTFAGIDTSVPPYVLKILKKLSEVKVLNVTVDRTPIGREEARKLLNLKMQRGGQEPLRRIQETVLALLGVQIDAFAGDQRVRTGETLAELDVDDFVVEVNGSGIKEALRLLLDIEFQTPNLILVEEPEIHLHPALETTMMRHLREVSQDRQVFVTTHSTNFLDRADMKHIYLVSKRESTSAQLLNQSEVEEQVPLALGLRLSSLFIYDRLVFVESQTDEDIMRAWASILKIDFNQSNVGFIHMGGARSLSSFATSSTLAFLAKRRLKMWFMLDRDEKDEQDINSIKDILGDNAIASILTKREIENYLVNKRTLSNQIAIKLSEKRTQKINSPKAETIGEQIKKAADDLKKLTIFKRVASILCQPLYPSRSKKMEDIDGMSIEEKITAEIAAWEGKLYELKGSITEVTRRQSEEVDKVWESRHLDIVPGDLLIDRVYQNYGVRFHKSRGDGTKLAMMMKSHEIDPEIRKLITSIGC